MDTLLNIRREMAKLCMHVYLVLSVRRSVEMHIQTQADKNKQNTYACIPRSKRQASNGDAYKCMQMEKKLHVHVYLVLSIGEQWRC